MVLKPQVMKESNEEVDFISVGCCFKHNVGHRDGLPGGNPPKWRDGITLNGGSIPNSIYL